MKEPIVPFQIQVNRALVQQCWTGGWIYIQDSLIWAMRGISVMPFNNKHSSDLPKSRSYNEVAINKSLEKVKEQVMTESKLIRV